MMQDREEMANSLRRKFFFDVFFCKKAFLGATLLMDPYAEVLGTFFFGRFDYVFESSKGGGLFTADAFIEKVRSTIVL